MKENKFKTTIISVLCIIMCIYSFACIRISENVNTTKKYIINTNTMRVHSIDCGSAKLISENNKKEIFDSLPNICAVGYRICKNCNCGLKRKYVYLKYELPSREEYLNAIDDMGEWYVNHIPTYQTELEQEKLGEYSG